MSDEKPLTASKWHPTPNTQHVTPSNVRYPPTRKKLMMFRRFLAQQMLHRATGGRVSKPNRIQALMRLPILLRIGYALFRDERVPIWQRATVLAVLGLIFSPLDLIGDIPLIGQFWDFTLAVVVLDAFIKWAPAHVVNEHIVRLGLEKKIPLRPH
jgi:uncharacterized membrane protein YkvA (DUF1232 family)